MSTEFSMRIYESETQCNNTTIGIRIYHAKGMATKKAWSRSFVFVFKQWWMNVQLFYQKTVADRPSEFMRKSLPNRYSAL